jgi:hypothetical protein
MVYGHVGLIYRRRIGGIARYSFLLVEAREALVLNKLTVEELSALCFANTCVCSVNKYHRRGKMLSLLLLSVLVQSFGVQSPSSYLIGK